MTASPITVQVTTRLDPADIELIVIGVANKLREIPVGWSVKDFAAHIKRAPSYVYAEIRAGRLRALRPGGKGDQLITPQAAMDWLAGAPK